MQKNRLSFHSCSRRGFTLLEVLVVIVILSVLASLLAVNYRGTLDPDDSAHLYDLLERRAEKLKAARIAPGAGPPSPP